jgi:hypothetical protein
MWRLPQEIFIILDLIANVISKQNYEPSNQIKYFKF